MKSHAFAAVAEGRLRPDQFVGGQLPGITALTTKRSLAGMSADLYPVTPRSFVLPDELAQWRAFLEAEAEGAWLRKSTYHRGIKVIDDPPALARQLEANGSSAAPFVVQQLIRPHLTVDGKIFDYGVYVVVTSLEPLVAWAHQEVGVLRTAGKPYPTNLTEQTDQAAYTIAYPTSWTENREVRDLRRHMQDADPATDPAFLAIELKALRATLAGAGVNTTSWWLDTQAAIARALQRAAPEMIARQRAHWAKHNVSSSGGGSPTDNAFALMRFDFLLGDTSSGGSGPARPVPRLVEVNHGLDLDDHDFPGREQMTWRVLMHDTIHLAGLAPGGRRHPRTSAELSLVSDYPDAVALGEPACGVGRECEADCSAPACSLCRACRTQRQTELLRRVHAETVHSRGFVRVHPPRRVLAAHMAAREAEGALPPLPHDGWAAEARSPVLERWLAAKCEAFSDERWC